MVTTAPQLSTAGISSGAPSVRSLVWRRRADALRRHAGHIAPTVLLIVILNFFLLRLVPGDAADVAAAEQGAATAESMAILREHMGLDIPIWQQFLDYLYNLAHLDLGFSYRYNAPVLDIILSRLPATLLLMGTSYILSLILGIAIGVAMASWRARWPDRTLNGLCVLLFSMPSFCVGILLILLFSVLLGWLPSDGAGSIDANLGGWDWFTDRAAHLVLPAIALSTHSIAVYARLTRTTMLEVRQQDFVRTAHAKGVHPAWVTLRHVLRNALIPISTLAGMQLGTLLGGAATVEMVFSWPGIGRLSLDAVQSRDYNTLLGILLLSSLVIVLANILVDAMQGWLDPRSRKREAPDVLGVQA
jgi:peptide/nickel transport system permease protein